MDYYQILEQLTEHATSFYRLGRLSRYRSLFMLKEHAQTVRRESDARGGYSGNMTVSVWRGTRELTFTLPVIEVNELPDGRIFLFTPVAADNNPYAGQEMAVWNSSIRRLLKLHTLSVRELNPITGGILINGNEARDISFEEVLRAAQQLISQGDYRINSDFIRFLHTLRWERNDPTLAEFQLKQFDYNLNKPQYDAFIAALLDELIILSGNTFMANPPFVGWQPDMMHRYDYFSALPANGNMQSMRGRVYMHFQSNLFSVVGVYLNGHDQYHAVSIDNLIEPDPDVFFTRAQKYFLPKEIAEFLNRRAGHRIPLKALRGLSTDTNWNLVPNNEAVGLLRMDPGTTGGRLYTYFVGTRGERFEAQITAATTSSLWREILDAQFPWGWRVWDSKFLLPQDSCLVNFI